MRELSDKSGIQDPDCCAVDHFHAVSQIAGCSLREKLHIDDTAVAMNSGSRCHGVSDIDCECSSQ